MAEVCNSAARNLAQRSGYQLIAEALKTYKGLLFYQLHGSVGYITFIIQQKHLIEYCGPLWKKVDAFTCHVLTNMAV